jgi:primosomal protein N'
MGKKANPTIIGLFVVGAIALAIVGVIVFGSGRFFKHTEAFVMFFPGSVNGLSVGAQVKFKGVDVGSVLVVPFGHRDVVGVVTGLADASEHDPVAPRRVLEARLPAELVDLALWMAAEYCSTPARALSLLLPPKGTRAKTALWAAPSGAIDEHERLSDRQRALLASLPRLGLHLRGEGPHY